MWLCTETLSHSEHRLKGQSWYVSIDLKEVLRLGLGNTDHMGKIKASLTCAFMYVHWFCYAISMYKSCVGSRVSLSLFFFINWEQHGFPLFLVTSVKPSLLSQLCCYGLGSLVMTASTHNVCALFCKLMVVVVCLLLMYIHYQPWFRHSMSLSELLLCFWTNSPWPKNEENRE